MRRVTLAALVFMVMASLAALAIPRQGTFQGTTTQMPQGQRIMIVAQTMQRGGGVTHATGNVQVRITHGDDRTVIYADDVIYHTDTGEIETRGDAKITIEKAQ